MKILLVEDDLDLLECLCMDLLERGHTVETTSDGRMAVVMAAKLKPDLLITDIGLPGLNGWSVAQIVRRDNPTIRIFGVTGWSAQADYNLVERYGLQGLFVKPYGISEIAYMLGETDIMPKQHQNLIGGQNVR